MPEWLPTQRSPMTSIARQVALALARFRASRGNVPVSARRLLIIDLDNVGDLLLATPAIRALRRRFPDATIDALVSGHAAPALQGNPHVDELLTCDRGIATGPLWKRARLAWQIRQRCYDLGVVLEAHWGFAGFAEILLALARVPQRIGRNLGKYCGLLTQSVPVRQQHWIDSYLDVVGLAGAAPDGHRLEYHVSPADEVAVRDWIETHGTGHPSPIVLFPGGNQHLISRRWGARGFAAVGETLGRSLGAPLIVAGGAEDRALAIEILRHVTVRAASAAGALTWGGTAALLRRCRLFITNDSGPLHLAAAVGAPTVAILGPTDPTVFGPRGIPNEIVRAALPCSPCIRVGDFPDCPTSPRESCLLSVTPAMVLEAARRLLARTAETTGVLR
jgi:heptosyltransferase-2